MAVSTSVEGITAGGVTQLELLVSKMQPGSSSEIWTHDLTIGLVNIFPLDHQALTDRPPVLIMVSLYVHAQIKHYVYIGRHRHALTHTIFLL